MPGAKQGILVVGGGIAGQAVCEAVRARDGDVPLTFVCGERHMPYDRVRIGALLEPAAELDGLRLRPDTWYEDHHVEVVTGARVEALDPDRGSARLTTRGDTLRFDRAVLCTGSDALVPPFGNADTAGVHVFRTPEDCAEITAAARCAPRAAVIGGGLLVVGGGMAAQATVETLFAHAGEIDWDVTVVAAEPEVPYNRVLLSSMLAGSVDDTELALKPSQWYADHGVTLRLGVPARLIDPLARTVELADGEQMQYDELVLATGSRPFVPPIPGVELGGVHVFRTRADARSILADAREARRAVVIGGGLLGLEAARALQQRGVRITVVHLAAHLMDQQLDPPAASLLSRALHALRIQTRTSATTEAIEGTARVERVRLAGGETIDADLVVIAAGIRPEVDLAATAGLEIGRGIMVDDELRTGTPGIRAVGECAEHRGRTYGLWSPLLEQTRALGASLADRPAAFLGGTPATTLKVAGIDLFCCGRVHARTVTTSCLRSTLAAAITVDYWSAPTAASPARSCSAIYATRSNCGLSSPAASRSRPSCSTSSAPTPRRAPRSRTATRRSTSAPARASLAARSSTRSATVN